VKKELETFDEKFQRLDSENLDLKKENAGLVKNNMSLVDRLDEFRLGSRVSNYFNEKGDCSFNSIAGPPGSRRSISCQKSNVSQNGAGSSRTRSQMKKQQRRFKKQANQNLLDKRSKHIKRPNRNKNRKTGQIQTRLDFIKPFPTK
jgi:hypothetical protein